MSAKTESNLLIVAPDYKPNRGGIAEYSYQVIRYLSCHHNHVYILTGIPGNDSKVMGNNIHIYRTFPFAKAGVRNSVLYGLQLPFLRRNLKRFLKDHNISYMLVTSWPGVMSARVLSRQPVRTGYLFHGDDVVRISAGSAMKKRLFLASIRRYDDIFCNSRYTAKVFQDHLSVSYRPIVTGCGISPQNLDLPVSSQNAREKLGITQERVLLTVGRLMPRKGIDMVIQCMPALRNRFGDILYLIAGDGPDRRRLEQMSGDLGCEDIVRFEGVFSDDMLRYYYCASDLFVMPNRFIPGQSVEGFGIVFIEAGYYGVPVIGGNSGGVPDAIQEGKTGYLVDGENQDELLQVITEALSDPAKLKQLGQNGHDHAVHSANWDHVVEVINRRISEKS